jgi:DNA-directed RNA polymerase specialized sigma subunit
MNKAMMARGYLEQAYHLDRQINSKLEQLESLNSLATKATSVLDGMPKRSHRATYGMADIIAKILDMQAEIDKDIDFLVDLKQEIQDAIKTLDDPQHRLILEQRYFCFKSWNAIAESLGYEPRHICRLHEAALSNIEIHKDVSKCHYLSKKSFGIIKLVENDAREEYPDFCS